MISQNAKLAVVGMLGEHYDVIKWKLFPRYWSFVRGNSPVTGECPSQKANNADFDVSLM